MKLVDRLKIPDSLVEAAAYWVMRLDSPDCSPADRAAFEVWRTSDVSHALAFEQARHALSVVDRHLRSDALTELGAQVFESTATAHWPAWRMGLVTACMLLISLVLYTQLLMVPAPEQFHRFKTAVGEHLTTTLPDGSIMTLNTDTLVEQRFAGDSEVRHLVLVRGEAYFQVEKDVRPFVVVAGEKRIVALGTGFDVRHDADTDTLQVTLVEGRLAVEDVGAPMSRRGEGPGRVARSAGPTELAAGEQLVVRPDQLTVARVDVERVLGWRGGWLVFRDERLSSIVREVNRYSRVKIRLDDDARLDSVVVGGSFRTGNVDKFVSAVESAYPVRSRRDSFDQVTLLWDARGEVRESDGSEVPQ